jgi:hypothetical protein
MPARENSMGFAKPREEAATPERKVLFRLEGRISSKPAPSFHRRDANHHPLIPLPAPLSLLVRVVQPASVDAINAAQAIAIMIANIAGESV